MCVWKVVGPSEGFFFDISKEPSFFLELLTMEFLYYCKVSKWPNVISEDGRILPFYMKVRVLDAVDRLELLYQVSKNRYCT